jgi:hypothetical protein
MGALDNKPVDNNHENIRRVNVKVKLKNAVFWNVTPCGSCKNQLLLAFRLSALRLLVIANVVPSSPILTTIMTEVICCSETSVLRRATPSNSPGDGIIHSHRSETSNLIQVKWPLQHAIMAYWGGGVDSVLPLATSAIDAGQCLASRSSCLTNKQKNSVALSPRTNYID